MFTYENPRETFKLLSGMACVLSVQAFAESHGMEDEIAPEPSVTEDESEETRKIKQRTKLSKKSKGPFGPQRK
jgi:hypothetical protein